MYITTAVPTDSGWVPGSVFFLWKNSASANVFCFVFVFRTLTGSSTGEPPGAGSVGALPCFLALAHVSAVRAMPEAAAVAAADAPASPETNNKPRFKTLKT
jgi:hypothetical protein